jgi:predicted Zn-dependent protease
VLRIRVLPNLPLAGLVALAACGAPRPKAPPPRPPPAAVAAPEPAAAPAPPAPRPEVLLARARALRAAGDVEGARARLEAALAAAPASDDLRLELADLLVADGREPDRAAELLGGVGAREGNGRWLIVSAQLAELRGDASAAAALYAQALALADDPAIRLRHAVALETLGRPGEAIAELQQVQRDRPDDPFVGSRLAACYEEAGRLREAETELVALAEATPDRAGDWERLAAFYRRTGRPDAARRAESRADAASGRRERALRPLQRARR